MSILWNRYAVTIRFVDRVVGGIPVVQEGDRVEAYERWARGQGVEPAEGFEQSLPEALAADPDMPIAADDIEGPETGFRRDDDGLYIEARQVKACLREAAERLGFVKKNRGTRQVLQHDLIVRAPDGGQKLRLGRDQPDGHDSRPISVVTRQGPRTAIKRFEYVTDAAVDFHVRVLAGGIGDGIISRERLEEMLELAQDLGIGADRSQGEGTFLVEKFEQID